MEHICGVFRLAVPASVELGKGFLALGELTDMEYVTCKRLEKHALIVKPSAEQVKNLRVDINTTVQKATKQHADLSLLHPALASAIRLAKTGKFCP